jgi:hypothetical protein
VVSTNHGTHGILAGRGYLQHVWLIASRPVRASVQLRLQPGGTCRMSPCRKARRNPVSASTPARIAVSTTPSNSPAEHPDTTARSRAENSEPSSAPHRSIPITSAGKAASRPSLPHDKDDSANPRRYLRYQAMKQPEFQGSRHEQIAIHLSDRSQAASSVLGPANASVGRFCTARC